MDSLQRPEFLLYRQTWNNWKWTWNNKIEVLNAHFNEQMFIWKHTAGTEAGRLQPAELKRVGAQDVHIWCRCAAFEAAAAESSQHQRADPAARNARERLSVGLWRHPARENHRKKVPDEFSLKIYENIRVGHGSLSNLTTVLVIKWDVGFLLVNLRTLAPPIDQTRNDFGNSQPNPKPNLT